jgi:hypothetical protein
VQTRLEQAIGVPFSKSALLACTQNPIDRALKRLSGLDQQSMQIR